jgi:hypothetical protein
MSPRGQETNFQEPNSKLWLLEFRSWFLEFWAAELPRPGLSVEPL